MAHKLASELGRLRGVSTSQAVLEAVQHELEREKKRRSKTGLSKQLLEIGRRCAQHIEQPLSSADHATMLYDEHGLPR